MSTYLDDKRGNHFFEGQYISVRGYGLYNDKKENQIFLIYKEIQSGAVAKSYTVWPN